MSYSEDSLKRIRENARQTTIKRYGEARSVTEERTCHCGEKFTVTYFENRKYHVRKTCSRKCAAKRIVTKASNEKRSKTMFLRLEEPSFKEQMLRNLSHGTNVRCSSKAERALADVLKPLGFKRHKHVTVEGVTFDVDIVSLDGKVWIESDGEWHFRQVHAGHDFTKTKIRDDLEEQEAIRRGILLIRVNNQTTSIDQQVEFITNVIQHWNGISKIEKLGF